MNKNKNRYVYVVSPGGFAGTPFFGVYEVENLVARPDELPEMDTGENNVGLADREWIKAMIRLPKVARRFVREILWRRAAKASGTVA